MFHTIQSFIEDYRNEAAATQRLLQSLTDESLKREIAPGYRTLGFLAWHLSHGLGSLLRPTGLEFFAPEEHSNPPATAAAIADAYRKTTDSLLSAVESQWTDAKLQETVNMFGEQWPNGLTLYMLIKHEIHHRGQLTVLMRQAGVPVSGIYGPTKEEWAAMGAPAPQ